LVGPTKPKQKKQKNRPGDVASRRGMLVLNEIKKGQTPSPHKGRKDVRQAPWKK